MCLCMMSPGVDMTQRMTREMESILSTNWKYSTHKLCEYNFCYAFTNMDLNKENSQPMLHARSWWIYTRIFYPNYISIFWRFVILNTASGSLFLTLTLTLILTLTQTLTFRNNKPYSIFGITNLQDNEMFPSYNAQNPDLPSLCILSCLNLTGPVRNMWLPWIKRSSSTRGTELVAGNTDGIRISLVQSQKSSGFLIWSKVRTVFKILKMGTFKKKEKKRKKKKKKAIFKQHYIHLPLLMIRSKYNVLTNNVQKSFRFILDITHSMT